MGFVFAYNERVKTDIAFLTFDDFNQMYAWLRTNGEGEKEVFVRISRQKPEKCVGILSYEDAVKAALCFGWIDSTLRNIDGVLVQRFSPRTKKSHWTEANVSRCIELDEQGLLTEAGKRACPYFAGKR